MVTILVFDGRQHNKKGRKTFWPTLPTLESEINVALCLSILKDLNLLGALVHYCQLECGYGFPALIHVWITSAGMSEWFISTSGEAMIAIKSF